MSARQHLAQAGDAIFPTLPQSASSLVGVNVSVYSRFDPREGKAGAHVVVHTANEAFVTTVRFSASEARALAQKLEQAAQAIDGKA